MVDHTLYVPLVSVKADPQKKGPFKFEIVGHKIARIRNFAGSDPNQWSADYMDLTDRGSLSKGVIGECFSLTYRDLSRKNICHSVARLIWEAFMEALSITPRDRSMAKICESCPICRHARRKQQGVAFRFVRTIENSICPFCQAYEKVHGRKAHEPIKY
jgi:hypothetical protein